MRRSSLFSICCSTLLAAALLACGPTGGGGGGTKKDAGSDAGGGGDGGCSGCAGKICGVDSCGTSCGTCSSGTCNASGTQCVSGDGGCQAQCVGKQCGPDTCGGTCGTCTTGTCNSAGQCQSSGDGGCTPFCTGKLCGAGDGCTGTCQPGSGCIPQGDGGCTPQCSGVPCGSSDGCGATCQPGSGCTSGGDGGPGPDGGGGCPGACPFTETCSSSSNNLCQCTQGASCGSPSQMGYHYNLVCSNVGGSPVDNQCAPVPPNPCPPGEILNGLKTRCRCTSDGVNDTCSSNTTAPKHCVQPSNGATTGYGICGGGGASCDTVGGAGQCLTGFTCASFSGGNYCLATCPTANVVAGCDDPYSFCAYASGTSGPTYCLYPSAAVAPWGGCILGDQTSGWAQPYWDTSVTPNKINGVCVDPGEAPVGGHCDYYAQRSDGAAARCVAGAECLLIASTGSGTAPYGSRCVQMCDLSGGGGPTCPSGRTCTDTCTATTGCTKLKVGYCK